MSSAELEADKSNTSYEGFPPEIYEAILDFAEVLDPWQSSSRRQLVKFFPVNRLFWNLARRRVFKKVSISTSWSLLRFVALVKDPTFSIAEIVKSLKLEPMDRIQQQDVLSLLEVVANNCQLFELTLMAFGSLQFWSQETDSSLSIPTLSLLTQPSLRILNLSGFHEIPFHVMKVLHVTTLNIRSCGMRDEPQSVFSFPSAQLERLTSFENGFQLVLLRALKSDSVRLLNDLCVSIEVHTFTILCPLLRHAPLLKRLELHIEEHESLEDLAQYPEVDLSQHPNLKTFILKRITDDDPGISELCKIFFKPTAPLPSLTRIQLYFDLWDTMGDLYTINDEEQTQWLDLDDCLNELAEISPSLKKVRISFNYNLEIEHGSDRNYWRDDMGNLMDFYDESFPQLHERGIVRVDVSIDD